MSTDPEDFHIDTEQEQFLNDVAWLIAEGLISEEQLGWMTDTDLVQLRMFYDNPCEKIT